MNLRFSRIPRWMWIGAAVLSLAAVFGSLALSYPRWPTWAKERFAALRGGAEATTVEAADEHAGHDHSGGGHAGHAAETSIELSEAALKNIGFKPYVVQPQAYDKITTIPGVVVERPGRSEVLVTAPLTGVVTQISATQGAAVAEGAALFEIRLTHEELVQAQSDLLKTAEGLAVIEREIARLRGLDEGIIAGKRIIEQEYEKQKLQAALRADKQTLLLHGLSQEQVDGILQSRQLVRSLTVNAPAGRHDAEACKEEHLFTVAEIPVKTGETVETGRTLGRLSDHCELYVEGLAFEDDAARLRQAMIEGRPLSAELNAGIEGEDTIENLTVLYLADRVDPGSRAFHFYASLPNEIAADRRGPDGSRFLDWRFKPGQRVMLRVPLERWENRFVVPVDALVFEGAEAFVYQQNGNHFDRKAVHVEQRDDRFAVIANEGALFPGDVIAGRGAYQMHLALKNKSGGAVDPHAGHNH